MRCLVVRRVRTSVRSSYRSSAELIVNLEGWCTTAAVAVINSHIPKQPYLRNEVT